MKKIISKKRIISFVLVVAFLMSIMAVYSYALELKCSFAWNYECREWAYCFPNGTVNTDYTGLAKKGSDWWYVNKGILSRTYSGLARNEYGWWHIKNGHLIYDYTGLSANEYGIFYLKNGKIDSTANGMVRTYSGDFIQPDTWVYVENGQFGRGHLVINETADGKYENSVYLNNDKLYTGLAKNQYGWFYMYQGVIDKSFIGLAKNQYGWFHCKNGTIDRNYTGMSVNEYGIWYVSGGTIKKITGMVKISDGDIFCESGWVYIKNGQLANGNNTYVMEDSSNGYWAYSINWDSSYTGLAENQYGIWYIVDGSLVRSITGLRKTTKNDAVKPSTWVYISNGKYDSKFTGIASNDYGAWYLKNGMIQFSYSGSVTFNGKRYIISKGHVVQ